MGRECKGKGGGSRVGVMTGYSIDWDFGICDSKQVSVVRGSVQTLTKLKLLSLILTPKANIDLDLNFPLSLHLYLRLNLLIAPVIVFFVLPFNP